MQNLNLNINKDDISINEYLYCLSIFDTFPNKTTIYHTYDTSTFTKCIDNISTIEISTKEVMPSGELSVINEKQFRKIKDGIYVSFLIYDKTSDLSIISDLNFFYKSEYEEEVTKLIEILDKSIIDYQDESTQHKFNILVSSTDGLQIEPIDIPQQDYEHIDSYYNESVLKSTKKMIKSIKSANKGLYVIYGERGVGKTSLMSYLIGMVDKMCIFIPANMIDTTLSNEFKNIIKRYKNFIIVIDDCEIFFSNTYTKSNLFTNNILQMVDGISSDIDNIHIVTILNTNHIRNIDPVLLECNNINNIIEVNRLEDDVVDTLCKHIEKKNKFKKPKLIDVLKSRDEKTKDIGF